ncbi:MAG: ArsR/SmtB family transcription factor [Thermoanaerobaculia bacterium]
MRRESLRKAVYTEVARIGKALGNATRLELLELLSQRPWTVEALARDVGESVANVSHHLQVLRRSRLVETERDGKFVRYRLAGPEVGSFFAELRNLGTTRLAEIERIGRDLLARRGPFEAIDPDALARRLRSGDVVLIDVRPEEEFQAGHIPGAVSVPLRDLETKLGELPRGREIVAYCRGPYCLMSLDAVELLSARGFRARRLEEGVLDWRSRGHSVAGAQA